MNKAKTVAKWVALFAAGLLAGAVFRAVKVSLN